MLRLDVTAAVEGRTARLAARRSAQREPRHASSPTRSTSASGRGRTATSTSRSGRVPPTFGAFARRTYATDNPLIGYPLAYQYLTSLRADALPANADELLRMRGRGWLSSFSVGNPAPIAGVPLVSAFRWDTGVQVHAGDRRRRARPRRSPPARSRNPLVRDDNGGQQVAGRRRAAAGRRADRRRLRRARPVRHADAAVRAGARRRATGATSRRPRGAPTSSTRAATTSCGSRRSSATGGCRSCARRHRRAAARRVDVGRRALQDPPGLYAAARVDHLGSATSPARRRRDVGRAGHARRSRRRLLAAAQSAAEARRISTTRATAAGVPRRRPRRGAAGVLVLMRHATRTQTAHRRTARLRPGVRAWRCAASRCWRSVSAGVLVSLSRRSARRAGERRDPRPRRGAPRGRRRSSAGPASPISARRPARDVPDLTRSVVYLESAPRGAFEQSEAGRARDGPAQRDVRAARARDHHRHDRRLSRTATASITTCSRSRRPRRFDLGRYAAGRSKSVRFDRPGIVRVFCDIHSHMSAFILVFSHPFFAMTDADGRYRIDNVPPGTYNVDRLERRRGVRAAAGRRCPTAASTELDFALR